MAKMSILVTGFEPFDNSAENPSARVVELLASVTVEGAQVTAALLPVAARRAPDVLVGLLQSHRPDAVLSLGEMRGAPCVRIERLAVNLLHSSIPDNDGVMLDEEVIVPDAPAAYWSTLPVKAMLDEIRRRGIPCVYSFSAGAFLCNQMMYLALHWCAANSPAARVGFMHLPSLPTQMAAADSPKPTMDPAKSQQAVLAAIMAITANRNGYG